MEIQHSHFISSFKKLGLNECLVPTLSPNFDISPCVFYWLALDMQFVKLLVLVLMLSLS